MSLNTQQVIEDGLKGILSSLLDRVPWDPLFGSAPTTAASDFDKSIGLCEEVLQSVNQYLIRLRRRKNDELASTKQLPPELLIHVWKEAVRRDAYYYSALGPLRLTSTRWAEIIDSDPSFWTVLSCGNSWEQHDRSLERSAELPLDVYFPCRDSFPVDFEDEDWADWTHDHQRFLDAVRPELHRVRSANISPHFSDWVDIQDFFAAGAPRMSRLDVDGDDSDDHRSFKFVLRDDFSKGIASALQTLYLTNCEIQSNSSPPFHFPMLHILKITQTVLSASHALHFLAASPTLAELTLEDCEVRSSADIPTSVLQAQLRCVRILGNRAAGPSNGEPLTGIGLSNIIDYVSSPHVENFSILQDTRVKAEIRSLGDWLAVISERYPAIWLELKMLRSDITLNYGPNFHAEVIRPINISIQTFALAITDKIHPSALPLLTRANFQIADSELHRLLPAFASRLPSITHLTLHDHAPLSWAALGRTETPLFNHLAVLELRHLEWRSEAELLDLLRARCSPESGPKAWRALEAVSMRYAYGTASGSLIDAARALGLDVQTSRYVYRNPTIDSPKYLQ